MSSSESDSASILLVEDSPSLSTLYTEYLAREGWHVRPVTTGAAARSAIAERAPDVMLLDLGLPDVPGMDLLREARANALPSTVIVITADGSVDVAVDAMREGAADFLVKPFDARRLTVTVRNALRQQRLSRMVEVFEDTFTRDRYHGFIGGSIAMQAVYRIIESAATSRATVFITGESGTGKELCAEAVHRESGRHAGPFVALNCAAIPRDLMESEVFGHVKGAFTGAATERDGAAARAHGGTLFLDEICEMDLDLQSKLLRFVQTGRFQKVGGSRELEVDVRFVCATNRDPLAEVKAGRFREDLYYRLHVIPVQLPALRERGGDVLAIAREFLRQYAREEGKRFVRFVPDAELRLRRHPWPGNVRELQNVIRNIVVLHDGELVTPDMLPALHGEAPADVAPLDAELEVAPEADGNGADTDSATAREENVLPLWKVERMAIERAIAACDGNVPRAAVLLDVSASTIYRKLQSWRQQDAS